MKYSDIITLNKDFVPLVDLQNEKSDYWKTFIPTTQFESLLETTLSSVSSNQTDKRKSIWVQGTFGTGKSHASSVIKHLLCDDFSDIKEYVEGLKSANIKNILINFRKNKRLFPVVLKGVESIHNIRTFSLVLEGKIKEALHNAGFQITVKSDFESAIDIIENKAPYLQELIDTTPELKIIAKTKESIIKKLKSSDIELFTTLEDALSEKYSVQISSGEITKWLVEVENEIRSKGIADCLFIIWDEFTSIMDTISYGLINILQNIAELTGHHGIYLYLISHRTMIGGEKGKDIERMYNRFFTKSYGMESITTYHIMATALKKLDETQYIDCCSGSMGRFKELIAYLTNNESQQSAKDIENLFPMHPYTAFLCSMLSNQIGSTNRSVFEFLYDDKHGFKCFLENETAYEEKRLLTADCFWDFFLDKFRDDPSKYGFVTDVYIRFKENVMKNGNPYEKVFKGILLFNAMKGLFGDNEVEKANPSEKNIKNLFVSEPFEKDLDTILDYFDKNQIVSKDPIGNFLINVSSLPPQDVNAAKQKYNEEYKDILKILTFNGNESKNTITKWFDDTLIRQSKLYFMSCLADESRIENELNKGIFDKSKSHTLQIALFFALNDNERQNMIESIRNKFVKNEEYQNLIFVVFNETFDADSMQKQKFIDYVAQSSVSNNRRLTDQASTFHKNALLIINQWINKLKQGNYQLFFRDATYLGVTTGLANYINQNLGFKIFKSGIEIMQNMRNRPMTFFKTQSSKNAAEVMLCALNREDAEKKFSQGQFMPAKFLFKDDNDSHIVNEDLTLKPNIWENHPLLKVQVKVDEIFAKVKKQNNPVFHLGKELSPLKDVPFGLYKNIPNIALLSYALRKYQNDFFGTNAGESISSDVMRDIMVDLFEYWEGKSNGNKLTLRFGSKEENELKNILIDMFDLKNIKSDLQWSSIKNVKWGIQEFCTTKVKYPLWSLKYCQNSKKEINSLIDTIIYVIHKQEITIDTIKKMLTLIKHNRVDFQILLANKNSFEEGFIEFVNKTDNVKIEYSWWKELNDYFKEKLQAEIGFWKEEDVKDKVKDFYIKKITPKPELKTPLQPPQPPTESKVVETIKSDNGTITTTSQTNSTKVKMVEDKIKSANLPVPALKYVLLKVLEEYPITADLINENLG